MNYFIHGLEILATIGLALFGVLYSTQKTAAIWVFFCSVTIYLLVACLYWQQNITAKAETASDGQVNASINKATEANMKGNNTVNRDSLLHNAGHIINLSMSENTVVGPRPLLRNDGIIESAKINSNFISSGPLVPNLDNLVIEGVSEGRKQILAQIVTGVLGVQFVLRAEPKTIIKSFRKVTEDIKEKRLHGTLGLNSAALIALRHPAKIINDKDELTLFGVSCLKAIAKATE